MRMRDERKAEFERREVIRKEKFAAARGRQKARAAEFDAAQQAKKDEAAATAAASGVNHPELTDEQRANLALMHLSQPQRFQGESVGSIFELPQRFREMKRDYEDIYALRRAARSAPDVPPSEQA